MTRKKKLEPVSVMMTDEWYTAGEAAKRLSVNSHREVKPDYLFKLGELGKVRVKKLAPRVTLYAKVDVDSYVVEERGAKSGRLRHEQAQEKKPILS